MSVFGKIYAGCYQALLSCLDKYGLDEAYLGVMFRHRLGYRLNLKNPKTYNEKLQWLKLYDRNPKYTQYADKILVRKHIAETLGEAYLIPLLGVYKRAEDIDFTVLPDQFVIKCNHGAKMNIICKNKASLDLAETCETLNKWLGMEFYRLKREYHYRDIQHLILCEAYMQDGEDDELLDYKLFCIGGKVYMIQVDFDRSTHHTRNLYDPQWKLLDVEISFPRNPGKAIEPPAVLPQMIEFAQRLSHEFAQVRVDFYVINGRLYFGEMTFFSGAGFSKYTPRSFEVEMGRYLQLPNRERK